MEKVSDLTDLPTDVFLIVANFFDARDIVRCRSVSKRWHREFNDGPFLRDILVRYYSRAREVRSLLTKESSELELPQNKNSNEVPISWKNTFDKVVARYFALKSGTPWSSTKLKLHLPPKDPWANHTLIGNQYPIGRWSRYVAPGLTLPLRTRDLQEECHVPTDLEETEWTYDAGLLAYYDLDVHAYVLLDIESNTTSIVPFSVKDQVVRRLRLKYSLLIVEWAERCPYHKLNEDEDVHRHFATAYDVLPAPKTFPWLPKWNATFRNEWKLHYLGFPLTPWDRWLSTHSPTHYAVYIWQPNRSSWGEDQPIESLLIWDISQPSPYRPSQDPTGESHSSLGPPLVKKLSYLDLDGLTIRQRDAPPLRKIELDEGSVYFIEEGCDLERGMHVFYRPVSRRLHQYWERIVGIPIIGSGPRWEDKRDDDSAPRVECGSEKSPEFQPLPEPRRASCWRYNNIYPGFRNQSIRDDPADIEFDIVQHNIGCPEIWVTSPSRGWNTTLDMRDIHYEWKEVAGDERWLLIQSKQELRILHFDREVKQGRSQLVELGLPDDLKTCVAKQGIRYSDLLNEQYPTSDNAQTSA